MLFAFILIDKPDSAELRQRVRPEHKAYLAAMAALLDILNAKKAESVVTLLAA